MYELIKTNQKSLIYYYLIELMFSESFIILFQALELL